MILLIVWWQAGEWYETHLLAEERADFQLRLIPYGNSLATGINKHLAQLEGLAAFAQAHPSTDALDTEFAAFAEGLYAAGQDNIRVIQIFTQEGHTYVYPTSSNEQPGVQIDVQRAIETRQITTSSPYKLRQGGLGFLAVLAVYQNDTLWGMAVIVLDIPSLLSEAGIDVPPNGTELILRDSDDQTIVGKNSIFAANPVIYRVDLPDRTWTLAMIPADGWQAEIRDTMAIFRGAGLILVGLVCGFVYLTVTRQARLTQAIQEHTAALTETRAHYQTLFDSNSDALFVLDPLGRIVDVNQLACQRYGYDRAEFLGMAMTDLTPPDLRAEVPDHIAKLLADQTRFEWRHQRKDGSEFLVEISGQAFLLEGQSHILGSVRDITEWKQAEEVLRERETRFRLAMENIPDVVVIYDRDLQIQFINTATTAITGRPVSDFIGRREEEIWPPDVYESYLPTLKKALETKSTHSIELDLALLDNTTHALAITCVPVLNEKGEVREILGITHDFTKRKQDERALQESEEKLRLFIDHAPAALAMFDREMRYIAVSRRWLTDYHLEERDIIGQSHYTVFPEIPNHWKAAHRRGLAGEVVKADEDSFVFSDGIVQWSRWEIRPWYTSGSAIGGIVIFSEDITEHRQDEEALRTERDRAQTYLDIASVILIALNQQGEITLINRMGCTILDYEEQELIGQNWFDHFVPERMREQVKDYFNRLLTGEIGAPPEDYENAIIIRSGDERIIAWRNVVVRDEQNKIIGMLSSGEDITARKQAEQDLRKLSQAVEHSPSIVYITNSDGKLEYVNPKFTEITGYTAQEAIGRLPRILDPNKVPRKEYEERWSTIRAGNEWRGVLENRKKNGEPFWETASISSIKDETGAISHFVIVMEDITEHKLAEEALRESQRVLSTLMSNLPGMAYRCLNDSEWTMLFVSQGCTDLTGYDPADLIQNSVIAYKEMIHPDDREMVWNQVRVGVETEKSFRITYRIISRNSEEKWVWEQGREVVLSDGTHVLEGFISDITERRRAENAEREQRMWAEALAETASTLTRALDLETVMKAILENVARVVPHDAANIMLLEGTIARVVAWRGYQDQPSSETFLLDHRFSLEIPHLNTMFMTGQPLLIVDTALFPDWENQPQTAWIRSHAAAPIRSHDNVIGFLNLDSGIPGFFTGDHAQRLQAFADQVSVAIEHAQLYEAIQRHTDELKLRVKERTAQLNQILTRIEAILNSSDDVIILCRTDGTISQTNPAFEKTFKCQPDEALFQPLTRLVAPEHVIRLTQAFEEVINTHRSQRLEFTVHCTGHAVFDADVVLSPIIEQKDHISGIVCSLRDITERKQMEAQLRRMLEHEMELSELKSRYVSMAAHDLRNPLAVIQSTINLIHQYNDRLTREQLQEKYAHIQTSIKIMVNILDDILILGKAEAGKLNFEPTSMNLIMFCENIVAETKQATGAPQPVNFTAHGECGIAFIDAKLLRHILGNLLSNALKYSPDASVVTFDLSCEPEAITFHIQDQGIGIPEADQKRLFEAFHRASNARGLPGTGLGLAIVKQSVELHGGTITFESVEGRGTIFTITLPRIAI